MAVILPSSLSCCAWEYAEFIRQSLYEEMGVKVKIAVGGVVNAVSELNVSFSQAETTFRMNGVLGSKGDIHSFKEYVFAEKKDITLRIIADRRTTEMCLNDEIILTFSSVQPNFFWVETDYYIEGTLYELDSIWEKQ